MDINKMSRNELIHSLSMIEEQFRSVTPGSEDEKLALDFGIEVVKQAQFELTMDEIKTISLDISNIGKSKGEELCN